jgi:hypothetical protein
VVTVNASHVPLAPVKLWSLKPYRIGHFLIVTGKREFLPARERLYTVVPCNLQHASDVLSGRFNLTLDQLIAVIVHLESILGPDTM